MTRTRLFSGIILFFSAAVFPCMAGINLYAAPGEGIFAFQVINTREIAGRLRIAPGQEVTVDWGDGKRDTFSGGRHNFSKDYGWPANTKAVIQAANESALVEFRMDQRRANIRFDLRDLPKGLKILHIDGSNTVTGDIGALPGGLTYFYARGDNTIGGDIAELPEGLTYFYIHGSSTVTGDIGGLPGGLTYFYVRGESAVEGDIAELPEKLTYFYARGSNTVTGDIGGLPHGLTHFSAFGSNTVSGDIGKLPEGLLLFITGGENTVKGDIGKLPGGMTHFGIDGSNTVSGDAAELPAGLVQLLAAGDNRISKYTPGRSWAEQMIRIELRPARGYGLSTEEVDSLIIDLSGASWSDRGEISVGGNNAPRSGASDEAVAALEEKGVSITSN